MTNQHTKDSLRRIVKRLEQIEAAKDRDDCTEDFRMAAYHIRRVIVRMVDDRTITAKKRNLAISMYINSELNVQHIGERLNIPPRTIYRWVRDEGYSRRNRAGRVVAAPSE